MLLLFFGISTPPVVIGPTPASRTAFVPLDPRLVLIATENRLLLVPIENRRVVIAAENRTVLIPPEDRRAIVR